MNRLLYCLFQNNRNRNLPSPPGAVVVDGSFGHCFSDNFLKAHRLSCELYLVVNFGCSLAVLVLDRIRSAVTQKLNHVREPVDTQSFRSQWQIVLNSDPTFVESFRFDYAVVDSMASDCQSIVIKTLL